MKKESIIVGCLACMFLVASCGTWHKKTPIEDYIVFLEKVKRERNLLKTLRFRQNLVKFPGLPPWKPLFSKNFGNFSKKPVGAS